ncbi:MAG: ABC transporter permease [Xanthomonadales bacterium]|nr:ABC transporter permease [Xanthomonadales bacterium]
MATPATAGATMTLDDAGNTLRLAGDWTLAQFTRLQPQTERLGKRAAGRRLDLSGIQRLDSAGALLIATLLQQGELSLAQIDGASAEQQALIKATLATLRPVSHPPLRRWSDFLHRVGQASMELLDQVRRLLGFVGQVTATLPGALLRPRRWRLTSLVHHIEQVGLDALPIIALLTFMVGAVITFLGAVVLRDFGASVFAVELVSFSFLREFGVLLTAILLAGRTASAFTAQIGAMKSREEIDAIRTLGMDPIQVLVIPRLLALLVALPLLTFIAMVCGILGGLVICAMSLDISPAMFLARFQDTFEIRHFIVGMIKAPVFAMVIGLIGCLEGFKVSGSAESVGQRTTSSVVQAIFMVILLDAIFALVFQELGW